MYSEARDAQALQTAVVAEEQLQAALSTARRLCQSLEARWSSHELTPSFAVELETGADDQPVLVFTIALELPGDFSTEDWPAEEVAAIKNSVRVGASQADLAGVGWYVTVITEDTRAGDD